MVTQIVYTFQSIEKKVMKGRIKESPWHSRQFHKSNIARAKVHVNLSGRQNTGDFQNF